ncbi:hypothetical protein LL912_15105 [Niabella sp. CC-SYL272]|uniref:hypothetical protein n=1 Tax=Niabella agricola TaxID=2891571 RepID=UPI001F492232|nr:hypothetical protein [Niabella agricola]MCF3110109.1 hypothetical protein [Niabella agricola]
MKTFKTVVWGSLVVLFLSGLGSCTVNAYPRTPRHRVWIPGHWSPGYHGYRHWVRGHYEYR